MADQLSSLPARRFGYSVAIAVNIFMLWIMNNLLEWGWPSWLTSEFDQVLPIINVSIVATIIVNLAYVVYDTAWFKSMLQVGLLVVSLVATVRLYQVFPFDFSAYSFNWEAVTRGILIFVCVAMGIGLIAEFAKFAKAVAAEVSTHQPTH
jgi:hypothetical protein